MLGRKRAIMISTGNSTPRANSTHNEITCIISSSNASSVVAMARITVKNGTGKRIMAKATKERRPSRWKADNDTVLRRVRKVRMNKIMRRVAE